MTAVYDLCIVGAGLVGSAAARYASIDPQIKVCVVGPAEPSVRVCRTGREIFGAHYDAGRITRASDTNSALMKLAVRSLNSFRGIEEAAGVNFYCDVGNVDVGRKEWIESMPYGEALLKRMDSKDLKESYPYLKWAVNDTSILSLNGGWINPRRMVDAQLIIASRQGCDVIRDVVDVVRKVKPSLMEVRLASGRLLSARKVLLATNVFTSARDLLGDVVPRFQASPQTVVLAEVSGNDLETLRNMPCVVYKGDGGEGWSPTYPRSKNGTIQFYMLPPIQYPNGRYYVKIGHSDDILKSYLNEGEVARWHCSGGDPELAEHLTQLLQTMFTGIKFRSFETDSCVTMVTPSGRPYIDKIHEQLGVAIGGNGHAGKSADEIGKVAAGMMLSSAWNYDIPKTEFKLVAEDNDRPRGNKAKL